MEYYLFEILYEGLKFENNRADQRLGKRKLKSVRRHFRFLRTVLQLINAIYCKVDEKYLNSVRLILIEEIRKNPRLLSGYDVPILHTTVSYPLSQQDYRYVLNALNYLFELLDECLSYDDASLEYLNLLIVSAYPLPRCMVAKGFLDHANTKPLPQHKAIQSALQNMDRTLRNEIIYIIRNTPHASQSMP